MLNALRHLLPDSTAWRLVVDRLLKQYLSGLATVGSDVVAFVDDVSDDLYPDTTRELSEWQKQFGLDALGSDSAQRLDLAAAWAATGGQSPAYIQSILHAAGFANVFVYDAFDKTDVSISKYDNMFSSVLAAQDASPRGFAFGAGGRIMYLCGDTGNRVYQYNLSSQYDPASLTYASRLFTTTAIDTQPADVQLSSDGMKMFLLGAQNDAIHEFALTSPWLVNTAAHVDSMSVAGQETGPTSFAWHPDGTSVYVTGTSSSQVHQYDLGTAWDISTGAYVQSFNPAAGALRAVTFHQSGEIMLVSFGGIATQFDLSTPWDISTAAASGHTLDMTTEDASPDAMVLEHGKLFMIGVGTYRLHRYTFGGPHDPRDYTNQPLIGLTQCGDVEAECGEVPPSQTSIDSAVCDRFRANEIWYLWNDDLTLRSPPKVPDDPYYWPHFWYVGGAPFGALATVSQEDRPRFEKLLLKLGPLEKWIVTMIDTSMLMELGPYNYDSTTGLGANGDVRFNSTILGSISVCRIGDQDDNAVNHEALLAATDVGQTVRVARTDDPMQYIDMDVTGPPNDNGGNWGVQVTNVTASAAWTVFPSDGSLMRVYLG